MTGKHNLLLIMTSVLALSACSTIIPEKPKPYQQTTLPIPETFPQTANVDYGGEYVNQSWRDIILDKRLREVIELALKNNRDLRSAVLNVDLARRQYDLQRTSLYPSVNGILAGSHGETGDINYATGKTVGVTTAYSGSVNASWEVDMFGRIRSLSEAAQQQYFVSQENRDAAHISLIAGVASAWLNLAADNEQLNLSRMTLSSREKTLRLVQKRFDVGTSDKLTLRQTQVLAETARNDVATLEANVQQDINALRLLVGTDIEQPLLPQSFPENAVLNELPKGLQSKILLKRPDVMAAEHQLLAADANINAARAAFFPMVSLTGNAGKASTDLGDLFDGINIWSFAPTISVPIFNHGANEANFESAKIRRDMAINSYEKSIQSAFRDVSDQLAIRGTIDDRLNSQIRTLEAAKESNMIVKARYDRGIDSLLALTDAERSLYSSNQQLIGTKLLYSLNLINLYSSLGGGLE
jgi:multidrug efflux system outer membrane protein